MKIFIISFGLIVFLLTCTNGNGSIINTPSEAELVEFVVSKLEPYREGLMKWIPALVNSPVSPTNYDIRPKLDYIDCNTCQLAVTIIKLLRKNIPLIPPALITEVIIQACRSLNVAEDPICRGTVTSFAKPVIKIIDDKTELTTADFCGILIPGCGKVNSSLTNWTINVDSNKPSSAPALPLDPNIPKTQILQFTDIHLDLDYKEGTLGNCGRPAGCCRDGEGNDSSNTAGMFGHFSCSLPVTALQAVYDHAKETHPDLKYIFLTGDYVHSALWLYNKEENSKNIVKVTTLLAETFPTIPIFPVVGNHEPDICNMYPPNELWEKGFDLKWMYEVVAKPFKSIPNDQILNFEKGGYYTVRPNPVEPFRIVVLNTNLCYLQNFWLVYKTIDPTDQLQWFANTMLEAEKNNEIVYILGHIQPGSGSCWTIWSEQFDRIIQRFEGIIKAQFYGHTHREFFTLAFNKDQEPISVSYVGPSGVTDNGHTAYKLYEVDGGRAEDSTWEIIDHKTYIMNLTSSNENKKPDWSVLYSAKTLFSLNSLRPADLYDLVIRMVTDDNLFQAYLRTHHKAGPSYNQCRDLVCRGNTLCDLVVSNSGNLTSCETIKDLIKDTQSTTEATIPSTPKVNGASRSNLLNVILFMATLVLILMS